MDNAKQQVVERIKGANNVLITVSRDPSVDQLSAAIGLALFLNKLNKHATAVFSGAVPSTIEFLEPEKTLEKNTDSLRDFIIALDKSKADKLRYKVEDEHVKIFLTPYRTSITEEDLNFSQGDFNVDVVVALGIADRNDLDDAITTNGRILHDATVVSISIVPTQDLGSINWVNATASSLCEMVADMSNDIKENGTDTQISTALLTGIVAETARFSNDKTTSATMSVSAKLLAAGANQQLVAENLQPKPEPEPEPIAEPEPQVNTPIAFATSPMQDVPAYPNPMEQAFFDETTVPPAQAVIPPEVPKSDDGALYISHDDESVDVDESEEQAESEKPLEQINIDEHGQIQSASAIATVVPDSEPSRMVTEPPTLGGVLTANSQPEGLSPSLDPMSATRPEGPILSHDSTIDDAAGTPTDKPFDPMSFITTPLAGQSQGQAGNSGQIELPPLPPSQPEPLPQPGESIQDLENIVASQKDSSAEVQQTASEPFTAPPVPGIDSARAAVNRYAQDNTPRSNVGVQQVDLGLPGDVPTTPTAPPLTQDIGQTSPGGALPTVMVTPAPPIPPPLMPMAPQPPQNPMGM